MEKMVRLCSETVDYLYSGHTSESVDYKVGQKSELGMMITFIGADSKSPVNNVTAIIPFCAGVVERCDHGLEEMLFGGTEEEIVSRSSDWCTDIARVACGMCQTAGVPLV